MVSRLFTPGEGNALESIRLLKYSYANSLMHITSSVENKTFCRISIPDDFLSLQSPATDCINHRALRGTYPAEDDRSMAPTMTYD